MSALSVNHPSQELSLKLLFSSLTSCLRSRRIRGHRSRRGHFMPTMSSASHRQRVPVTRGNGRVSAVQKQPILCSSPGFALTSPGSSRASGGEFPLGLVPDGQWAPSTGLACTDRPDSETCGAITSVCPFSPYLRPSHAGHTSAVSHAYRSRHSCREACAKASAVSNCPLIDVVAELLVHSCLDSHTALIAHSCHDPLELGIFSLHVSSSTVL